MRSWGMREVQAVNVPADQFDTLLKDVLENVQAAIARATELVNSDKEPDKQPT
jgi:hypothetical protein